MLGGIISFAALVIALIYLGRAQEKNDEREQVIDDINKANKVCADLEHDPAADERVRDQFTR